MRLQWYTLISNVGQVVLWSKYYAGSGYEYALFRFSETQWGYVSWYQGCCAGCDLLRACESRAERLELQEVVKSRVVRGNAEKVLAALGHPDNSGDDEVLREFRTKARAILCNPPPFSWT